MLRGLRWPLVALFVSAAVFALALVVRLSAPSDDGPAPTPTQVISAPDTPTTPASTPAPTVLAQATQATTTPNTLSADHPPSADGIVTYREALVGAVKRLNPLFADLNPVDRDITSLIYEGLTRINEHGEAVPHLAESWVTSADGLEVVVRLRDDVLWHDGTPFSADDVLLTMRLLGDPAFPGNPSVGAFWRTVETQKLADDLVRFRLAQPLGSFLHFLSVGLLPEHALRGVAAADLDAHPFNLAPIGTGPYQLEAFRSRNGVTVSAVDLRVAPVYRQRPEGETGYALDRLRFRLYEDFESARNALQAGEVDALAARDWQERPALLRVPQAMIYTSLAPRLGVLIYNWDEGEGVRFFREQRVRVALQQGLNRETPIENRLSNRAIVADSPLLPTSWAYRADLPWPSTDPIAARALIEDARIQYGEADPPEEGEPFYRFSILVPDDPALVDLAQQIATQWAQLNLDVSVEPSDPAGYQARLEAGDFDAAIVELHLGADPDVYPYWHIGQYPDGLNYGGMADDLLSETLERARQDAYGINRAELYAEFQHDFIARAVALPLYYPLFTYAVHPRVEGVQLGFVGSPEDRFRTLRDWTLSASP